MSKNLVICCDGTNNEFGPQNTNVVRLVQSLDRDPAKQRMYYDPGVGTLPQPGLFTRWAKKASEWAGLAFGVGLTAKVEEAYSFLMELWEPGDQVYLFGFSRGAYTVRVLAGMLHSLGLLARGNDNLVPYVMKLFKAVRTEGHREDSDGNKGYWELCDEFRWSFARQLRNGDNERNFRVHFLGVWDTVSSVGWAWDPVTFPYTRHNPSIDVIRHAVSIDERRWFFRQNLMKPASDAQDLQERWFAGVHSDVGGGYPEKDGGLWRGSFNWMLDEAARAGLLVNRQRLQSVMEKTPPSPTPWDDCQHESLKGAWWVAEYFPKWQWTGPPGSSQQALRIGGGGHRFIEPGAMIHKSTLLRIREKPGYAPPNMSKHFLDRVRGLEIVPDALPFKW